MGFGGTVQRALVCSPRCAAPARALSLALGAAGGALGDLSMRGALGGCRLGRGSRPVRLARLLPRFARRDGLLAGPLGLSFGFFHSLAGALELLFRNPHALPRNFRL